MSETQIKKPTLDELKKELKRVNNKKEIIDENKIKNVEAYCEDAGKFFEKLVKSGEKFDITILDPPRKGCSRESLDYVYELSKDTIIYVSCNPATLARDLNILQNKGAKIISLQPFDMFCHTYHVETVAIIKK